MGGGKDLSGPGLNERQQFPWTVILRAVVQQFGFRLHTIGRLYLGRLVSAEKHHKKDEQIVGMA